MHRNFRSAKTRSPCATWRARSRRRFLRRTRSPGMRPSIFPSPRCGSAAELGMGGVYISPEVGGSGLSPARRHADLRGARHRLPDRVGLHVDPQHGGLDDRRLRLGGAAPAMAAETVHHGASGELLPDRARRRLGRRGARHARRAPWRPLCAQRPEAIHLRRRRRRSLCGDGADRRCRARGNFDAGRAGRHRRAFRSAPTNARWAGMRSRRAR